MLIRICYSQECQVGGIWPGAAVLLATYGDGFVSGQRHHSIWPSSSAPAHALQCLHHLSSFAWNWNILFTMITNNKLHFLLVFIFSFLDIFKSFFL